MKVAIEPMSPIILSIRISGGGRVREIDSLLDTGASYLVIANEDALDLGHDLAAAPRFPVVTANGVIEAPLILLQSVQLGPYLVRNVPTLCLSLVGDRISSLLGLSLLAHFTVSIDSRRRILVVEDS